MLDTRFKQYQDAVIGTVLTTLRTGSVSLTFYPNFNLSLQDPNLPTTLKVQVQIQGAEQIRVRASGRDEGAILRVKELGHLYN